MEQISFVNEKAIKYAKEALIDLDYAKEVDLQTTKKDNIYEYTLWNHIVINGIKVKKIVKSFNLEQFIKLVEYGLKLNGYKVYSLKEVISDDYFYFEAEVEKVDKVNNIQKLSKVVK